MSILINMEMPTHCMDCHFMVSHYNNNCILQSAEANEGFKSWKQMKANCPLIPIPPHGDLIGSEDTQDQGLLVRLPCKVGDTVWSRNIEPWTVVSVEWFSRKVTQLHCKSPVTGRRMTFSVGKRSLGKTVFLTREEAEAAPKGEAEQDF